MPSLEVEEEYAAHQKRLRENRLGSLESSIGFWVVAAAGKEMRGLDCDDELENLFQAMVQYRALVGE